ncbi:MAG: ribonuclease P protein component [Candidatus Dormibacteraeota bacterium]|nr:ribonuclease P protein component [Candidatus Dormibacteraeota bacterium]
MKKRTRLVRRRDFQRVLGAPRLHSGPSLLVFAVPSPVPSGRVGVTVSRRVSGAVNRNRARRRAREAVRLGFWAEGLGSAGSGIPFDVVVIARPPALEAPFGSLLAEMTSARRRLVGRR